MGEATNNCINDERMFGFWLKRTTLERCLILLCLALFITFASLVAVHVTFVYKSTSPSRRICNTPVCKREAGRILKNMNPSVNPCEDFYRFTCGSFMKYETVSDQTIGPHSESLDHMIHISKEVLKTVEDEEPDFAKKVKKLYKSCLNGPTDASEIIVELLTKSTLQFWPYPIYDDAAFELPTLEEVLSVTTSYGENGANSLFSISHNGEKLLLRKGNNFIDEAIFLSNGDKEHIRRKDKYIKLLILTQFQTVNPTYSIGDEAYDIADFQRLLTNVTTYPRKEDEVTMTVSQLHDICSQIKWRNLFDHVFETFGKFDEAQSIEEKIITVESVGYVRDLCQLVDKWGSVVVENLLVWNFLAQALLHLDPSFQQSLSEIDPKYYERNHYSLRWKQCINEMLSDVIFRPGLNYLITKHTRSASHVKEIKEYVSYMEATLDDIILNEAWLDDFTKELLRDKFKKAYVTFECKNKTMETLEDHFKKVIVSDNYIENWLRSRKLVAEMRFFSDTFALQSDIKDWQRISDGSSIGIPLEFLVPPIFIAGVPKYLNFGTAAFLIAREMSRNFNNLLSELRDANTSQTSKIYEMKRECFFEQFSQLPSEESGIMMDGVTSTGEIIADKIGISLAFSAYLNYLERSGKEENLPGLDYTNRQMFYIRYSQLWCELPESLVKPYKRRIPGKHRVLEPLMSFPAFSQAFHCAPGSAMNPWRKCRMFG